ncbi:hypothetical protein TRAPUB_8038, partial [Trametes pubescens]
ALQTTTIMQPSSSESAVHRCLPVSEIFQLIVDSLDSKSRRRTLLSLAQTCKMLYEASVPALWKSQFGLVRLLRLLPSGTWSEVRAKGRNTLSNTKTITKPNEIEWTRFHHYAQHVRTLYWDVDQGKVSLDTLSVLESVRDAVGQPLFPKLDELQWYEPSAEYFSFIRLFLTPTIRTLVLALPADFDVPIMVEALNHVGKICRNMERLQIVTDEEEYKGCRDCTGDLGDALAESLEGMARLKSFTAEVFLSANCMAALAELPALLVLQTVVEQAEVNVLAALTCLREGPYFPALRLLALNVDGLDGSTETILQAIQSGDLHTVSLHATFQPGASAVKQHLEVIAASPYRNALISLRLGFDRPFSRNAAYPAFDVGHALQPLYALPQIDTFTIQGHKLIVDASTLRDIATAWRKLEILSIIDMTDQPHPDSEAHVPLDALVPFARGCPSLYLLELHANALAVPDEATVARLLPQPSQSTLQYLGMYDAPITSHADPVAAFLARLFPNLREVEHHVAKTLQYERQEVIDLEGRWKDVQDLLQANLAASKRISSARESSE